MTGMDSTYNYKMHSYLFAKVLFLLNLIIATILLTGIHTEG